MKILIAVDGSAYTRRMLDYLATHHDLLRGEHEYLLFTAVAPIPSRASRYLGGATVEDYYRDQADEVLKVASAFAEQQQWKYRVLHAHGHAAEAVAACAEAEQPDLIVMGTHGHSALGNMVLGSVTSGVLARCKPPVLLIR